MAAEIVVFCTTDSNESAEKLSTVLLENKLAACVNIMPSVHSFYTWQGKTVSDDEILLIIKSNETCFTDLEKAIVEAHPYEVPEILALPVVKGYHPYLDWLNLSLSDR